MLRTRVLWGKKTSLPGFGMQMLKAWASWAGQVPWASTCLRSAATLEAPRSSMVGHSRGAQPSAPAAAGGEERTAAA
eukprot:13018918-Alexandrium_andersonii.AAC.1